jgi:hypothetical protein
MQRKSLLICLLSSVSLLGLLGCQARLPPPPIPPHQGVTLNVACPAPLGELIHSQSSVWRDRQQASVKILPLDRTDKADILVIRPNELAGLVTAGKLIPLPSALQERGNSFEWSSLLTFYREHLVLWDGKNVALPLLGESPLCLYRGDLFDDPAHQEKFRRFAQDYRKDNGGPLRELRPPASWEDFALIAEYFHQNHPLGKNTPALPPLPADDRELDRLFSTVAASYARRAVRLDEQVGPDHLDEMFSFYYDQATGEQRLSTPGFVEALKMLKRLQGSRQPGSHLRPEEAFLEGKAVLCITDAPALLAIQKALRSSDRKSPARVGICLIPGSDRFFTAQGGSSPRILKDGVNRVPYLGGAGWLAVVPATSANSQAAFDLLADLCGPVRSTQIVLEPRWNGPTRVDHVLRERWGSFDLDPARSQALKETLVWTLMQHRLKNPLLCLRTPNAPQQQLELARAVRNLLLKGGDPKVVLESVGREWSKSNEKIGKQAHLRDYRLSLGLLEK